MQIPIPFILSIDSKKPHWNNSRKSHLHNHCGGQMLATNCIFLKRSHKRHWIVCLGYQLVVNMYSLEKEHFNGVETMLSFDTVLCCIYTLIPVPAYALKSFSTKRLVSYGQLFLRQLGSLHHQCSAYFHRFDSRFTFTIYFCNLIRLRVVVPSRKVNLQFTAPRKHFCVCQKWKVDERAWNRLHHF